MDKIIELLNYIILQLKNIDLNNKKTNDKITTQLNRIEKSIKRLED